MKYIELIRTTGGYWAAHCGELNLGCIAKNRQQAINLIGREISVPSHSRGMYGQHSDEDVFVLSAPGHHLFKKF